MKLNKKFDYPVLERIDSASGFRYYLEPKTNRHLHSVTTILSATSDNSALENWREYVGEAKANAVCTEATNLGTLVHSHMEATIQELPRPGGNNLIRKLAANMADQIINRGLINVEEVWCMEEKIYYPGLYAGTMDLCGLYNGEPAIMDYKTAKKMKSLGQIENYLCQLTAYAAGHNELFGTTIQKGVIFMVDRDLKFEQFVIEGAEFAKYQSQWFTRLEKYLADQEIKCQVAV